MHTFFCKFAHSVDNVANFSNIKITMPRSQPLAIRLLWQLRKEGRKGHLNAADKADIVGSASRNNTLVAVAKETGRSVTTVGRVVQDWNATGTIQSPRRGNSGRPRTATAPAVVKRVVKELKRPRDGDPIPSAREVKRKLSLPYAVQSVRNAARKGGLSTQSVKHCVFLTAADRRKREVWARKMCRRPHPVDWRRTLCTDEKVFVLKQHQRRCFAPKGLPRKQFRKHHPESLLVWGGISLVGSTDPIFVRGIVDSHRYQQILALGLIPLARRLRGPWYFQQDNARPHTSASTKAWFTAHPSIPAPIEWPANSPDASPIENLWALLQRDVDCLSNQPTNLHELEKAVAAAWGARTSCQQCMVGLLGSWERRVEELSGNGGAVLSY